VFLIPYFILSKIKGAFMNNSCKENAGLIFINRDWVWCGLLVLLTFFAYKPAWNGGLVWDDDAHITQPQLRPLEGLLRIWLEPGAAPQYYPIVHTVFWVQHRLFGDAPLSYHLLNIFLHVTSSLLLVVILRKLSIKAAWLAGWIFALHPVMVESVAWMTELKNTLSCFFMLSSAIFYLEFDDTRSVKHYVIALVLFALGLLAKSVIVVLPVTLLIIQWWKRGKIGVKQDIYSLLPFFTIGLISGLFTAWVERRFVGAVGSEFNFTGIDRCLIAGRAIWFYLYKLLWPVNLIFIYPRWDIDSTVVWQYIFPVAFLIVIVLLWGFRNRSRAPFAVLLYFAAALFPALGFFNVYPFRFSFVADHFQYHASIAPIIMFAAGIDRGFGFFKLKSQRLIKWIVTGLLLTVLFCLSWKQSSLYRDAETLYKATIHKNKNCWLAYNNLGLIYAGVDRNDDAMAMYLKALEIKPDIEQTWLNIGNLHTKLGRTGEAAECYRKALNIRPDYTEAHNSLAMLLTKKGENGDAVKHLQIAQKLNPDDARHYNNLGIVCVNNGQINDAIVNFRKALALKPYDTDILENLVAALVQGDKLDEVASVLETAIESAHSANDSVRIDVISGIYDKVNSAINSRSINNQ
jgi:tetratricopeptide (TPR) repeat protein